MAVLVSTSEGEGCWKRAANSINSNRTNRGQYTNEKTKKWEIKLKDNENGIKNPYFFPFCSSAP